MDLKSDLTYFVRTHKKAVAAALISIFIIFAVFACSGIRYEIRLSQVSAAEPRNNPECLYYNHLTYRQQLLYDAVLDAMEHGDEKTDTIRFRYTAEEYRTVMDFLCADHPAQFRLDTDHCTLRNGWNASDVKLTYFAYGDSLTAMNDEFDHSVKLACNLIGERESEYETALAVHDFLIHHTEYTDETPMCGTAYGALTEGRANGLGYALAFDVLCKNLGIESYTVFGQDGDLSLAWNIHRAGEKYYHTDVCSDDPNWKDPVLFHGFFGLSGAEMTSGRTPSHPYVLPQSQENAAYFEKNGLSADSVSTMRSILVEQIKAAAEKHDRYIELRITFSDDISLFSDVIGESIRHAKSDDPKLPLREDFRVYSDPDANGAATIELFYLK